jgi:hypothetical protein
MAQAVACICGGFAQPGSPGMRMSQGIPRRTDLNAGLPALCAFYILLPKLPYRSADIRERIDQKCRNVLHARNAAKRNQGNQQRIFDQVLALFVLRQILQFDIQLQK